MRKLAEQSAKSASFIGTILGSIQEGVDSVAASARRAVEQVGRNVDASRRVEAALGAIHERAERTSGAVAEIARVTREQTQASQAISGGIDSVARAVSETSQSAEVNRGQAEELLKVARELDGEVARLRL